MKIKIYKDKEVYWRGNGNYFLSPPKGLNAWLKLAPEIEIEISASQTGLKVEYIEEDQIEEREG